MGTPPIVRAGKWVASIAATGGLIWLAACAVRVAEPARPPGAPPLTTIVFLGDSLVHRSAEDYGMLDSIEAELRRRHPRLDLDLVDAGVNGDRIEDIERRLDHDALALHPAAVVLYWDSDVSDVDESALTPAEVRALREAYERRVRAVLDRLRASGTHVVMSGPSLIGERPRGANAKDAQLDAYRAINRRVAASLGVAYLDTRRALFAARPPGAAATVSKGLVTEDGEHLNASGVRVVQAMFMRALDTWLTRAGQAP